MSVEDIASIIICISVCGSLPIWIFFDGIVKIIRAFKGLDNKGYDQNKIKTYKNS